MVIICCILAPIFLVGIVASMHDSNSHPAATAALNPLQELKTQKMTLEDQKTMLQQIARKQNDKRP